MQIYFQWRYAQLLPVQDRRADFDYENSCAIHEIGGGLKVQLDYCRRADEVMFNICNNVENVDVSDFGKKHCVKSIAYHNHFRMKVNKKWMEKFSKTADKSIELEKFMPDRLSQDITLYQELPLMACKTNMKYDIANGEEFTVDSFDKINATLKYDGTDRTVKIPLKEITQFFYPSYCITVHKSQGSSFDFPYTIYEFDKFDERLKYVALSRSTNKNYINIFE